MPGMNKRIPLPFSLALAACAALLVSCGRSDDAPKSRPAAGGESAAQGPALSADDLAALEAEVRSVTLICDRESLIRRWKDDRNCEWRTDQWLEASLASLPGFAAMENTIDTSGLSAEQVAEIILQQ